MNSNDIALKSGRILTKRRLGLAGDACSLPMCTPSDNANADPPSAGGCTPEATNTAEPLYRSPSGAEGEAIVCTADLADKPALHVQLEGYRAAFAHLVRTERFTDGFRWVFRKEPGLDARLKLLAENEHECCRFLAFELMTTSDHIVWETRASAAAASVLEFFSRLPERLSEEPSHGADVLQLKQHAGNAGLEFAADGKPPR